MNTELNPQAHGVFDQLAVSDRRDSRPLRDDGDEGVIHEFIAHVRGIIPLLEGVKNSIEESSSRIPKASMQLNKVTEATESATVEILNVLELMTSHITTSEKDILEVLGFIRSCGQVTGSEQAGRLLARIANVLAETKESSMNIAIALQVQDITSQQLAGVSHTIESIRQQLSRALKRFDQPGDPDRLNETGARPGGPQDQAPDHFDGEADFSRTPDRQDRADEIIKQWTSGKNI